MTEFIGSTTGLTGDELEEVVMYCAANGPCDGCELGNSESETDCAFALMRDLIEFWEIDDD